jgi:hypothetical protein
MSSRLLFLLFCIASVSTGCIVKDEDGCNNCNPPPPPPPSAQRGDVTFLWTLGGLRCDQARDIIGVNITIPGESLVNGGRYACSTANVDGITLHDFRPGSYAFTLQGVDFQNQLRFQATGTFIIDGDKTVMVDLVPTGSPGSYAYLNWTFPGNSSCAQAGVSSVDITLDGQPPVNFPCTEGQATPGLRTPYLSPGLHDIAFVARAPSGQPLYSYSGKLTTRAYDPVYASYELLPPAQPGDVTFLWTFDGRRCDEARDVYGVNITIPGEVLANGGKYACSTANVDGIVLQDFAPGTYSFTLEGVDFQNQILFRATGTFVINGDRRVMVDLAPVGNPSSYAYLNWTFPGNSSCAQAGVASVDITLDGQPPVNFACSVGQSSPGLRTPSLAPGTHPIDFVALDSSNRPLYYFRGTLVTQAYNPVSATYSLTAGGASISWRFSDGSTTFDCNALDPTGNLQVGLNFQDTATGEWVYGTQGDFHRCGDKPIVYTHLRPGTYKVSLYARTSSNVEYRSNPSIPSIQVQPNVFPGPNSALEVTLFRQ